MLIKVVFDCMIFLQAAVNPNGPAAECFRAVRQRRLELYVSRAVLDEVADVLRRLSLKRRFPRLTEGFVTEFISHLVGNSVFIDDVPDVIRLTRDPKDECYLNLARRVGAIYLVTRDNDLLDIAADSELRQLLCRTEIVRPEELLERLRTFEHGIEG